MSLLNPPAFPREDYQASDAPGQRGMSLRDWFAGQLAPSIFAGISNGEIELTNGQTIAPGVAVTAYQIADAMLAARATEAHSREEG